MCTVGSWLPSNTTALQIIKSLIIISDVKRLITDHVPDLYLGLGLHCPFPSSSFRGSHQHFPPCDWCWTLKNRNPFHQAGSGEAARGKDLSWIWIWFRWQSWLLVKVFVKIMNFSLFHKVIFFQGSRKPGLCLFRGLARLSLRAWVHCRGRGTFSTVLQRGWCCVPWCQVPAEHKRPSLLVQVHENGHH